MRWSRPTSIAASCACAAARSTRPIADFDRAIALDPNQPEAYLNKGAALIRRKNAAEAVQLFTVALEHNTTRPAVAHYGRAVANEALGNVAAAYRDYRRASELAPTGASRGRADPLPGGEPRSERLGSA